MFLRIDYQSTNFIRYFMAHTKAALGKDIQLADSLSTFASTLNLTTQRVREVLEEKGVQSQRKRDFPAEFTFYFVLGLCLYRTDPYRDVVKNVVEELRHFCGDAICDVIPSSSAMSQARSRLGSEPFEVLYSESVRPTGSSGKPGVFYKGYRVMSIDGSTFKVPDEKGNIEYFGYSGTAKGQVGYPQLRFVALAECATHVMMGAKMGPISVSEQELAKDVLNSADSSMLVLADRGFVGYPMWQAAGKQGCKRLFRIKGNQVFPVKKVLPDGSFISEIYPDNKARRRAEKGETVEGVERVRIIEFELQQKNGKSTKYRLKTDLLDDILAPALDLVALYHRRWRIEVAIDELKTHLCNNMVLRSKTPELVRQEFYAMLIVHGAIRRLMSEAADTCSLAPEELSFVETVRILSRRLPRTVSFFPQDFNAWEKSLLAEIAQAKCRQSRGKRNPRGVKQKMSKFRVRSKCQPLNQTIEIKVKIV